jgi:hypothetical protein
MKDYDEEGLPTKELYLFMKYNKIFESEKIENLNEYDLEYYKEYRRLYKEFREALMEEDNTKASSLHGTIQSMFGFNRHYCAVTGTPIVGQYYKLGAKIVSKEAYDSYMIIQEMEKRKNIVDKKNKTDQSKTSSKTFTKKKEVVS